MSQMDDQRAALAQNLQRLGTGDRDALGPVYRATSAKLFGICLRILGDRKEAEDALQEVYIDVMRRADRFDADRASPISWLASIARNRSIDRLRRGGKVRGGAVDIESAADVADSDPPADIVIETAQRDRTIEQCLKELGQKQQSAIRGAFFGGITYAELADRQGVPLGTMKSWVRRGLAQLKGCLKL